MLSKSLLCSALVVLASTVRSIAADDFTIVPNSLNYANSNVTFSYTTNQPLDVYAGQTYTVALYRNTSANNYAGTKEADFQLDFVPQESGTLSFPLNNATSGDDYYIRIDGPNGSSNSPTFVVQQPPLTESEIAAAYANDTIAAVFKTIKQPQEGTKYTGDDIIIIWEVSVPGGKPASLDLVTSKNSLVTLYKELATVKPNATSYTWTIGSDIASDSYAVRLGYPASNSVVYSPTFKVIGSKAANSTNNDAADVLPGNGLLVWSVAFATALTVLSGGVYLQ